MSNGVSTRRRQGRFGGVAVAWMLAWAWSGVGIGDAEPGAERSAISSRVLLLAQIPIDQDHPIAPSRLDRLTPPPAGSRIVTVDLDEPGHSPVLLTLGFEAAGAPCLSYDAKRVLFAGRRDAAEATGIWEINVDGTGLRHVYTPSGGCDDVIYLSTLYTIDAPQPTERIAFRAVGYAGKPQLFSCAPDGEDVQQITYAPEGVSDPYLLTDGRLLFGMRDGASASSAESAGNAWFTINTDGTDVFPFAAVDEGPARRSMPFEADGGRVLYVEQAVSGHGHDALVAVSLARSLHTRQVIADARGGKFHSPSAARDGAMLVSYRAKGAETFGVRRVSTIQGGSLSSLFDDPDWHDVDGQFIRARVKPPGRSSVVRNDAQTGRLYCLDAYISSTPEGAAIQEGQLARLHVWTPQDETHDRSPAGRGRGRHPDAGDVLLGGSVIEPDGSFSLELPARLPFRLETADREGRVLQSMRTWIWVMPMERRGCIGCHEDRELTPPNRHVIALRKQPQKVGLDRIGVTDEATGVYGKTEGGK